MSHPEIALVQFPGSNCDMDCIEILQLEFGIKCKLVRHTDTILPKVGGVVLPGGFSYGDYLRGGALASHAPIMNDVKKFAKNGGAIIGICNGFQVLTESHLLPGILLRNAQQKFVCKDVQLKVCSGNSVYHQDLKGGLLTIPIAHGEGRYYIDDKNYEKLKGWGGVLFQYTNSNGDVNATTNPNGSVDNIAGVVSENGRVMGMMPHPERASQFLTAKTEDGKKIWQAFLKLCS